MYAVTASQMDMFLTEDNPARQQAEKLQRKSFFLQEGVLIKIVYLGIPIVPPVMSYSSGTQNEKMETVGSETEAYAMADKIAIAKDIQLPKYFQAQEAIAYGTADKIVWSRYE
ncbi:hypothetical protein OPV22_008521 [Ensete ventricosum]|uniref:ATP-dependent Clp protease proteolytic subunit n=1 Tax=Ensete ventricosum TaxID=4639 RepID=A0AAV8REX4_ENSVE|nr:hypothetical protein OPV22_008521 [Ensete ventricosum]